MSAKEQFKTLVNARLDSAEIEGSLLYSDIAGWVFTYDIGPYSYDFRVNVDDSNIFDGMTTTEMAVQVHHAMNEIGATLANKLIGCRL